MHTQRWLLVAGLMLAMSAVAPAPTAQGCAPEGDIQFLCGPVSPEDLILVPDTPWVIVSGMENDGYLYVADIRDHSSTAVFPTAGSQPRHDTANFGDCPGSGDRRVQAAWSQPASGQQRPSHALCRTPRRA